MRERPVLAPLLSLSIAAATSILPLGPARPAVAGSIAVTTLDDELNADGDCSLREALRSANSNGTDPHDACAAGSGPDTISLPAGSYVLGVGPSGDDAAVTGDLDITSEVTVDPQGSVTFDGANLDRVFHVLAGGSLTLSEITITRGLVTGDGGAILNSGALTLTASTVSASEASGSGGGVANEGTAVLENDTLSGNRADGNGGGLSNSAGGMTLNNLTVVENTADDDSDDIGNGGGLAVISGTVNVGNTILGNNREKATGQRQRDCSGTVSSRGYNLIEDLTGCTLTGDTSGTITGKNPGLEELGNNGGPTLTRRLRHNSPALDAANPAKPGPSGACEITDQRGTLRPQGPRCDMGAFELAAPGGSGASCLGVPATVVGTNGNDVLTGSTKADGILALAGNDLIVAGKGKDGVCAGEGNDAASGEDGADRISLEAGNDRAIGGGGSDLLQGGGGNDRLRGRSKGDTLRGGPGRDRLNGGPGVDVCLGGPGKDTLRGCERRR